MAQAVGTVGKYAANKFLGKHMKEYKNKKVDSGSDPYFAMVEDPRHPGKYKKVKKQIPAYIPEHDAMVLASVRKNAYRLDMCLFNFLGIRFGWEAVIGFIPFAGDAIGVALAMMLVKKASTIDGGLTTSLKLYMILNVILDFLVGLVPIVGDIADAAYKCNTRNVRLLEVHLDKKYKNRGQGGFDERDSYSAADRQKRATNRKSGIFALHDPPPATVFEDFSEEDAQGWDNNDNTHDTVQRPAPAQQPPNATNASPSSKSGGWFGKLSGSRANPAPDVEMAQTQTPYRQETGRVRN